MPITHCPGCSESLEVPAVVPGGLVACPYCGEEFATSGSGGGGRPRGGGGARRGRGRDSDDYDDGYGRRGGYRKKADPVPIIVAVMAILVLGGVGAFFLVKKSKQDDARQQAAWARVAATPSVSFPMPPTPPPPDTSRPAFDIPTVYKEKDLVTLMELSYSSGINEWKNGKQLPSSYPGLSYSVKTEEHGERVTASDGRTSTHEGHYLVPSYVWGVDTVLSNITVDATFKLNNQGLLIPGTFQQTGGTTITPPPEFIANRGQGALPGKPVLLDEVYGKDRLDNTLPRALAIDGHSLESISAQRQRVGGWRVARGDLITKSDGSWTNTAALDLRLYAVENGIVRNFTYRGQPAELSFATKWTGEAEYLLQSQILVRVGNLKTVVEAQVRTKTDVYRWSGQTTADMKLYRDR